MLPPPTIILYDGWCSLCTKSAEKLTKLDNGRGRLRTLDLREQSELLEAHNLDPTQIRRVMHAITPDAEVLQAMDALRHTMRLVGRGWMLNWTRLPIARPLTDRLYLILASNRLRWFAKHTCTDGSCQFRSD